MANFFTDLFACCHERKAHVSLPGTPKFSKRKLKDTIIVNVQKFRRVSSLQHTHKMGVCSSPKRSTQCGSSYCSKSLDVRKGQGGAFHTARFGAKKMLFCSTKCWEHWAKNPSSSSVGSMFLHKHVAKTRESSVKKNPSFSNIAKQIARAPTPVGTNIQGYTLSKHNKGIPGNASFTHLYYASNDTVGIL